MLLAKVGKRVLVLEQHDRAGGCCHTFTEKGFEFDVGKRRTSGGLKPADRHARTCTHRHQREVEPLPFYLA